MPLELGSIFIAKVISLIKNILMKKIPTQNFFSHKLRKNFSLFLKNKKAT